MNESHNVYLMSFGLFNGIFSSSDHSAD